MQGNRLVIGLDYGTTFTDNSTLEKQIEVITDWPSRNTMIATTEKVPSEIAYTLESTHWGSSIPTGLQRHMWTKLELDPMNKQAKYGEAGKIFHEQMSLTGISTSKLPVDVVADFLRKVKEHLIQTLDTQFGPKLWRTLPITLVVTVPAVWSDAAKDRTMRAVDKGGFNNSELPQLKRILTITEPEAAAIHTIKSFTGSVQDEQFAVGDGFAVCDMGGGTVDLISYRVADLNPTTLEEATIGGGDQCGGSFVDRGFLQFLERRLGHEDFFKIAGSRSENVSRTSMPPKLSKLVQTFIVESKSGFTGKEVNFLPLPRPLNACEDDEARGIVEGEIMITVNDMIQMFESPLARVYELLLEQIQQARQNSSVRLKYIFLVGGFSQSPYVYSQIKAFAEKQGLLTIRPASAWSAIVRGATAKGLEGDGRSRIRNRKCRRSYGTDCMSPFVSGRNRVADQVRDQYTGVLYARDQMEWIMKKGQDLSTSSECHGKIDLVHRVWRDKERFMIVDLLASNADKAPYRSKHPDVYTVATLRVNLESVPQKFFKAQRSPSGDLYYELAFNVEISVQSALEFSVSVGGRKYGLVTAQYT
ncbi:hypothetical protein N0V94_001242 [Neodidymelliopsis sp. IMI 364377]|nr:hypothetical protein N0V94_001242 [Neodidymelliopsis sp. IMI 364377]